MLNSYAKAYNNLTISATSGTLIKSHPKSFTRAYQFNSTVSDNLHDSYPKIYDNKLGKTRSCVIIQTMVIGSNLLLSEVVWLEDYLDSEVD